MSTVITNAPPLTDPRWIPTEKILPEFYKDVWIYNTNTGLVHQAHLDEFRDHWGSIPVWTSKGDPVGLDARITRRHHVSVEAGGDPIDPIQITHWMPIP